MVGLLLFYWLLPETKGRTLEEMEILFSRPRKCPLLGGTKCCRPDEEDEGKPAPSSSTTGPSGSSGGSGGSSSSKTVQYVQIRGLNRDRKDPDEED